MNEIVKLSMLLEIYKNLITQKQREVLNLYYNEDLSLAEIAETFNISRQAVRDNIKSGEKNLLEYESKMKLLYKREKNLDLIQKLGEEINLLEKNKTSFKAVKQAYEKIKKSMEE